MTNPLQALFMEEQVARDSWLLLSSAEESFFKQKSCVLWLDEGDANTCFFHKLVKANQSRNVIHFLWDESDTKISDLLLLNNMVIQYYFQLLGTENPPVQPYLVNHIQNIHLFRFIASLSDQLFSSPTDEEIK